MSSPSDRLVDVVTALLVEDGFEGVSVRKVATRAGVSIGAVQHHFPTKDAMLAAAMTRASEDFNDRLRRRVPPDADAPTALRELADELVSAEPDQRVVSVLWVLRAARAAVDPPTAAAHAEAWGEVADLLTGLVRASRTDRNEEWAAEQATELLALIDGIGVTALLEPARMPAERARRLVASAVERVLTMDRRRVPRETTRAR